MSKVYIVTSGEYSSYHVDGVFDSEDQAYAFMSYFPNNEYNDIDVRDLNPMEFEIANGFKCYYVWMEYDGFCTVREENELVDIGSGIYRNPQNDRDHMTVTCMAKSEAHAMNIANEKRLQYIASGEWK